MRQLEPGLTTDLTARQEEVLDFIEDFLSKNGMPPTRKEIADGFGWKSPNAAEQVLRRLEKLGRIMITPSVSRGIRLSDEWRLADR